MCVGFTKNRPTCCEVLKKKKKRLSVIVCTLTNTNFLECVGWYFPLIRILVLRMCVSFIYLFTFDSISKKDNLYNSC